MFRFLVAIAITFCIMLVTLRARCWLARKRVPTSVDPANTIRTGSANVPNLHRRPFLSRRAPGLALRLSSNRIAPMIRNVGGPNPFTYRNDAPVLGVPAATEALEVAARALRAAENVCVLTGAGISAESGVPTFRDALTGLWANYDPRELATPDAFERQPDVVWSWYAMRAAQVRKTRPNAGHYALAKLAAYVPHFTLLTQNVDDLHRRAGHNDIVSLHGDLLRGRCSNGCNVSIDMCEAPAEHAPRCPDCGALMRPDVVWFGETLAQQNLERARNATFACDVFLSVGTSNLVEPAASLPWLAAAHGATVMVVNASMTGQKKGPSILQLQGSAGATLSKLVAMAFAGRKPRRSED